MGTQRSDFARFLRNRFRRSDRYGLGFTLAFLATAAALLLFLLVLDGVTTQRGLYRWDAHAQALLQPYVTAPRTRLVVALTNMGGNRGTIVGVVIVGFVLLALRRWHYLLGLLFASGVGGLVLMGLKLLFQRARPLETLIPASGYSFPSGHAFAATVFFGYVIYLLWRLRLPLALRALGSAAALLLMLGIGASRIYLNVHYLTDVAAGHLTGLVWLLGCLFVLHQVEFRRRKPEAG